MTDRNSDTNERLIPVAPQPNSSLNTRGIKTTFGLVGLILLTAFLSSTLTAWLAANESFRWSPRETVNITSTSQPEGVAVVEKVADSVVSINTETTRYDWFGRQAVAAGAGSGFVVSRDGYIITNNHVVENADTVVITTTADKQYVAKVIETDAASDLALLKVDGVVSLEPAELGDSSELKVGETVYAVGNALGRYPNSVTQGIVSGLGRPITAVGSGLRGSLQEFEDLIQTDAAINSGNSGGPLVNGRGQVVGINTAVAGQAQNIGFSVPISRAQELIERVES
ncbi:hypothetical protein B7Y94_06005 [Candidatus Saccharibacteria bacterium 32-49-12]|nr:MAG: hypothetical protein B7Y94_06005 [Candidatus Saccharibacteria bacterium 32-49-12]